MGKKACEYSPSGQHEPEDGLVDGELRKVCRWCGKNLGR